MIELKDLVGGYKALTILHGVSFQIETGKITTVIGPNGAGKSTVFKAIFGMLRIHSGHILIDGEDTTHFTPAQLLDRGVIYIPQGRNIFPELSVFHNLELGTISLKNVNDIPQRLEKIQERFPILREKAKQQAITLSGGQQKLLEIARGLLCNPKIMLIDEPSIGLSPIMMKELFHILTNLRDNGVTILMVEQNAKKALEITDNAIVLEQGQTRMVGKAADLLNDPRVGKLFLGGELV